MFLIQGALHEPMEGSKSPFQAPEPRAGAWSHQGGLRVSHARSLDSRGTWSHCGLAARCQARSLDGRGTWTRCGLAAITNKLFYGRVGGQCLPDSISPALLAWMGFQGPGVRAQGRPACGLSLGTRLALCSSGCPGGETQVCAEHTCALLGWGPRERWGCGPRLRVQARMCTWLVEKKCLKMELSAPS